MTGMDAIWIFWVPLFLLFASTTAGAIVKNQARDACLKKFHGSYVVVRTEDGRWFWGVLQVFSTCLELVFHSDSGKTGDYLKRSYIFYEPEIQTITSIFRLVRSDEKNGDLQWQKEIQDLIHQSLAERASRQARNVFNILRDAFSQSVGLVVGLVKTRQKVATVPALDQRGNEFGKHLLAIVPNAYEPVLERYVGREVIVQSLKPGLLDEQVSILEEYTERFLLVRDVPTPANLPPQALLSGSAWHVDAIHARRLVVVRHLAERMAASVSLADRPHALARNRLSEKANSPTPSVP
jgi:hypothetical protein